MDSRAEAIEQYRASLRRGQKYYRDCVARGTYPYPQVLDDQCKDAGSAARVELGTMEIPMDCVVGTLADGRKSAFAGDFMPLLDEDSEFAAKWINLCEAHLNSGIRDPIVCLEYMGRFYVQEGHKRVSVLSSYGALAVRAKVSRVIPAWSEDPAVMAYYEFMDFYKRSQIYGLHFSRPGCWDRLEKALNLEPGHEWTREERADFLAMFWKIREACPARVLEQVREHNLSEVVLACLEVYPYEQLKNADQAEIRKRVEALLPDLRFAAEGEADSVSTEPKIPDKNLVVRLLDGIARPTLNIAVIHVNDPATSSWTRGHDEGCRRMAEALGSQVRLKTYVVGEEDADTLMERAIDKDGAQVVFVTATTLLASARQAAALHPGVKVLVCALSVPYVGVRTYYSRIYEAKFVAGAISGAMCGKDPLGYVANYPILGVPASVNAFALGVRMTNPSAKVLLEWSCLEGKPEQRLWAAGARIISGYPAAAPVASQVGPGWCTALLSDNGSFLPLVSDVWNWGKTYEQIVRSILAGAWDAAAPQGKAVNYWWGMSSGVIDVELAAVLPEGVKQLAGILKRGIITGSIDPFEGMIHDQEGKLRATPEGGFTPEQLMRMNWLCDNVIGRIPRKEELLPMSQETTRLLELPEDQPAKEEAAESKDAAEKTQAAAKAPETPEQVPET